jgi:replicative DNA helicase
VRGKADQEEHFFIPAHADIYATLLELWDVNKPIDFITLTQVLRDRSMLDQCGGAAFVTELFTFLPTAANAAYYIEILQEKYTPAKSSRSARIRRAAMSRTTPNLLNDVEAKVFEIAQDRSRTRREHEADGRRRHRRDRELYSRRGSITGLATGFADFDKMTDGLHGSEMVVIAARLHG